MVNKDPQGNPETICWDCCRPTGKCRHLMESELNKPWFYSGTKLQEVQYSDFGKVKKTMYRVTYCPMYVPPVEVEDKKAFLAEKQKAWHEEQKRRKQKAKENAAKRAEWLRLAEERKKAKLLLAVQRKERREVREARDRQILVLWETGITQNEIAKQLGCTKQTVSRIVCRDVKGVKYGKKTLHPGNG